MIDESRYRSLWYINGIQKRNGHEMEIYRIVWHINGENGTGMDDTKRVVFHGMQTGYPTSSV